MAGMIRRPANKQVSRTINIKNNKPNANFGKMSVPGARFIWHDLSKKKS